MGKEEFEERYLSQLFKSSQSGTDLDTGSVPKSDIQGNSVSSSLPSNFGQNEAVLYESIARLSNEDNKLNSRLEQCEAKLSENQKKINSIEKMCKAVSSLSSLIYKLSICIIIFIVGFALIIFRLTHDGVAFDLVVALVGLLGVINLGVIWNVPKKIEALEEEIEKLKTK